MPKTGRPNVLITGSSGFLGQAIARGLLQRYHVIGLDSRPPKEPIEGLVTVGIDLTSDESVREAMGQIRENAGNRIASVIHLAAYYDTTGKEHPKYDAVTVQGTRRLLEALKTFEAEQFIFASTLLVHAPSPERGVKINENWSLEPPWAYPQSKAETEALIMARRGAIGQPSSPSRSPAYSNACRPPTSSPVTSPTGSPICTVMISSMRWCER